MKFAAIDIGSNAMRLLLTRVLEGENGEEPFFKKEALMRFPLRLGEDAFTQRRISDANREKLIHIMRAYRQFIEAYEPITYRACATSAMREVENGQEIVEQIRAEAGLQLEIIHGKQEAEIIFANHFERKLNPRKTYLYIDVGGGSTELTVFDNAKSTVSRSFKIGTVRLLKGMVPNERWKEMKHWIHEHTGKPKPDAAIGSGGNINKIFRIARRKEGKPVPYKQLREIDKMLNGYSFEERIRRLNLRPDRADVIIPASRIYLSVMKWADIPKIYVPQIGLADGIVHLLYEEYRRER